MTSRWWRVQAFWFVNDDLHWYQPVYYRSADKAEAAAQEIRETLWHFPNLDIRITSATDQEVQKQRRKEEAYLGAERAVSHLRARDHNSTVCGLSLASITSWCTRELWHLVEPAGRCSACDTCKDQATP